MRPKLGFWEKPKLDYLLPLQVTLGLSHNVDVRSPEVAHVAKSFQSNFGRALNDIELLMAAIQWSFRGGMIAAEGKKELSVDLIAPPDYAQTRRLKGLFELETGDGFRPSEEALVRLNGMTYGIVDDWLSNHGYLRRLLEQSLQSVLVYAWTAFEVLIVDLWTTAVNLYPRPLAINAIDKPLNWSQDKPTKSERREQQDKSEALDLIKRAIKYGETIQAGNLLKLHKNRFNFDKYADVRDIYRATFDRSAEVNAMLDHRSMLDMHVLDAVRNVIIHNSARADRNFLEKSTGSEESKERFGRFDLLDLDQDEPIPFYGDQVHRLLTSELRAAAGLLVFVDDWLVEQGHTKPPEPKTRQRPTPGWPFGGFISLEDQEEMKRKHEARQQSGDEAP